MSFGENGGGTPEQSPPSPSVPGGASEPASDWMWALARHYERMRTVYPDDLLAIVFDIDGTILDTRHLVVHALLAFDREHGRELFHGLRVTDVTVPERRIDLVLEELALPQPLRREVLDFCEEHLWSPPAILAASIPYRGVLGVIRWFQLQPNTVVALNTGRPEDVRRETLESLNTLGRAYRVTFRPDLLLMNPHGWGDRVVEAKVAALRSLQDRGLRVVAVVDNEPANIGAMAGAEGTGEILFLHADTIFESQREPTPRTVAGDSYRLPGLVSEQALRGRVQFVWHGVNDEANLRQFLGSEIRWAECDVRVDPLDRLVLRHDSFSQRSWHRAERPFPLEDLLSSLRREGRCVKLDLKDGAFLERVLQAVAEAGFEDERLWFNASIEVLGKQGFRRVSRAHPGATISCPIDFAGPLLVAAPELAEDLLETFASWGVTRLSLSWTTWEARELLGVLESLGWDVNLYGVPDLHAFLEAALLLPASVTADFNFPDWHYFGRGSGQHPGHHRYELATTP